MEVGRGSVTLINATPFGNRDLTEFDHGALFVAATQLRRGDRDHLHFRGEQPSLLALIWMYGAPVVVLCFSCWRPRCGAAASLRSACRRTGHVATLARRTDSRHRTIHDAVRRRQGAACRDRARLYEAAQRRIAGYARLQREADAVARDRATRLAIDARSAGGDHQLSRPARAGDSRNAIMVLELHAAPDTGSHTSIEEGATCKPKQHDHARRGAAGRLREAIGQAMVGQNEVVEQVIITLVASGHALIEGVPGLGKTLLVRALSQALSLNHARVQFTPDMMPSDITGHAVLDPHTRELRIVRGPVFTQVLLADEINRAPAKTQSALLEVMQEYQVTLEGQTLAAAAAVLRARDPESGRNRRHVSAARSAARSLPVQDRNRLSERGEEVAVVVRTTTNQTGDQLPLDSVKPCPERTLAC